MKELTKKFKAEHIDGWEGMPYFAKLFKMKNKSKKNTCRWNLFIYVQCF